MRTHMRTSPLFRVLVNLSCLVVLAAGCGPKQVRLENHHAQSQEILIPYIEYDPNGLPLLGPRLKERPTREGDRFTIVELLDGRTEISYDVVVAGSESDFSKPFRVIYEWTGKGFQAGAQGTGVTANVAGHTQIHGDRDAAVVMLAIVVAPLVIATAGGFLVGVADSVRTTIQEMIKVVRGKHEKVVTYTTYAYDAANRLILTRMFKADETAEEVIRTEFSYQRDSRTPFESIITTYPDGAKRVVK